MQGGRKREGKREEKKEGSSLEWMDNLLKHLCETIDPLYCRVYHLSHTCL